MARNIPFKRVTAEPERMIRTEHARTKLVGGRVGRLAHEHLPRRLRARCHPPQMWRPVIKKNAAPHGGGSAAIKCARKVPERLPPMMMAVMATVRVVRIRV